LALGFPFCDCSALASSDLISSGAKYPLWNVRRVGLVAASRSNSGLTRQGASRCPGSSRKVRFPSLCPPAPRVKRPRDFDPLFPRPRNSWGPIPPIVLGPFCSVRKTARFAQTLERAPTGRHINASMQHTDLIPLLGGGRPTVFCSWRGPCQGGRHGRNRQGAPRRRTGPQRYRTNPRTDRTPGSGRPAPFRGYLDQDAPEAPGARTLLPGTRDLAHPKFVLQRARRVFANYTIPGPWPPPGRGPAAGPKG